MISENSVRSELIEVYSSIEDLGEEDIMLASGLEEPFRRLDRLASQDVDEGVLDALLSDPELQPVLEGISRLRNLYGLRLEVEEAGLILVAKDPWRELEAFTYYPNYSILSKAEQEGANLKPGDTVAFLGSGPLPLSLIILCREHGLRGIGIERDPRWVQLSCKVIGRLGQDADIEILEGDHFSIPLRKECDLIMVAAMARPKEEIFGHLARALPVGTKVSYRIYEKGLRRVLDLDSSFRPDRGFDEIRRIRPDPPVNNTVVFLERRD